MTIKIESKEILKSLWHFIWEEDSILSWLVNILLAFVLIKYIVYPGLGLLLGTYYPVVAVVSESMEHNARFDDWWKNSAAWYSQNGINKEDFEKFSLKNGFNKGDIMVLRGKKPKDIQIGDIIVFWSAKKDPIIHRVVRKWNDGNSYHYETKGDNYKTNPKPIQAPFLNESNIDSDKVIGSAIIRIPLLGYIKIWFVDILNIFMPGS